MALPSRRTRTCRDDGVAVSWIAVLLGEVMFGNGV